MKSDFSIETRQSGGYIPDQGFWCHLIQESFFKLELLGFLLVALSTSKMKEQFYCLWNGHFTFLSSHSISPRNHTCHLMKGVGKRMSYGGRQTNLGWIPSLPLTGSVTLGKLNYLNLPEPGRFSQSVKWR